MGKVYLAQQSRLHIAKRSKYRSLPYPLTAIDVALSLRNTMRATAGSGCAGGFVHDPEPVSRRP